MMKKNYVPGFAGAFLLCAVLSGCGGAKAPEEISFEQESYVFGREGQTWNLAEEMILEGENVSKELSYTSSDKTIVEVSPEGMLTVKGKGQAVITAASAEDEAVSATAEVLVQDYTGIYTGEKYIDAMGCNVKISLQVKEDGTFSFFRYPMYVALEGGGKMESFAESGSYEQNGGALVFTGSELGEFALTLRMDEQEEMVMEGDMPTGGAATKMTVTGTKWEDRGESGIYTGTAETEAGEEISYRLELDQGVYTLLSGADVISKGIYAFGEKEAEFFAEEGMTFHASYVADRQAIEGTAIPAISGGQYTEAAATFIKGE